jgi:hypothetical protein
MGAGDLENVEILAETVNHGDPSYTGQLAGASLRLPVYPIVEPELKECIPKETYRGNAGILLMTVDTEEIGRRFKAIRDKALKE